MSSGARDEEDLYATIEEVNETVKEALVGAECKECLLLVLMKRRKVFARFPGKCNEFRYTRSSIPHPIMLSR